MSRPIGLFLDAVAATVEVAAAVGAAVVVKDQETASRRHLDLENSARNGGGGGHHTNRASDGRARAAAGRKAPGAGGLRAWRAALLDAHSVRSFVHRRKTNARLFLQSNRLRAHKRGTAGFKRFRGFMPATPKFFCERLRRNLQTTMLLLRLVISHQEWPNDFGHGRLRYRAIKCSSPFARARGLQFRKEKTAEANYSSTAVGEQSFWRKVES